MGYCITQIDSKFTIRGEEPSAGGLLRLLRVMLDTITTDDLPRWGNAQLWHTIQTMYRAIWRTDLPRPPYNPMGYNQWLIEHMVQQLFAAARYHVTFTVDSAGRHSIVSMDFFGQKDGYDSPFLAMFNGLVEPGSYITFRGEDGKEWTYRWVEQRGNPQFHVERDEGVEVFASVPMPMRVVCSNTLP